MSQNFNLGPSSHLFKKIGNILYFFQTSISTFNEMKTRTYIKHLINMQYKLRYPCSNITCAKIKFLFLTYHFISELSMHLDLF